MPLRVIRPLAFASLAALASVIAGTAPARSADPSAATEAGGVATQPALVAAADAAAHIGEECVVEMVVQAARSLADKDVCFLNSEPNHRDDQNLTVVIFKAGLARFRDAGIENPALHFLDERIHVRGVVAEHEGRPQIVVEKPGQIEIVARPNDAPAAD